MHALIPCLVALTRLEIPPTFPSYRDARLTALIVDFGQFIHSLKIDWLAIRFHRSIKYKKN